MGFFDVTLIATNSCGSDQLTKINYIEVMPDDSLLVFGFLNYDNFPIPPSPMNNIKIYLNSINQIVLDSVITDAGGYYVFDQLAGGTSYIIEPYYDTKPWGGSNSGDALKIMLHFVGLDTITGLALQAADVSDDGVVNSIDALNVQQRFVGMIPIYVAGDWVATFDTVNFNGHSVQIDLFGICFGDVNQSYIPPMVRSEAGVSLSLYKEVNIQKGENFEIPIRIELLHCIQSGHYKEAELYLHKKFDDFRIRYEWFKLLPEHVCWIKNLKDGDIDELMYLETKKQ